MNQQEPPVISLHKATQSDISDLTISDQSHDTPTNLRSTLSPRSSVVTTAERALRPFFAPVHVRVRTSTRASGFIRKIAAIEYDGQRGLRFGG